MPISRKEADDAQFKVYFGARDGQLALIGEIKRVQSYHESLKSRLRSAFDAYNGYLDKDTGLVDAAKNSITAEIARTSAFLTSYKSTQDPKEKVKLISAFDDRYPINYNQLLRQEKGGFIAIRRTFDAIFLQAERQNILESFRNISNDNKPTYSQYDDLFTKMSAEFAKFERPALIEQVNRLPPQFTSLANRDDYESMSAEMCPLP